jgi:hypothetical protein
MKNSILDIWNDLRQKRLWPVAVLLLVGLVAVPVALSKSSEEPPSPAPVQVAPDTGSKREGPKALASVKLDEALSGRGSALDTFDPSDPFLPPSKVLDDTEEAASSAAVEAGPSDTTAPTETGSTGSTGVSEPGSTGGETGGGETGGGTPTTTDYTYVIDVTFTANGRKRKTKGMDKLDILPSPASPLLIFMGVTDNGGNAVFLVDATLKAAGEGKCKPSASKCAFLFLGPGAEQKFTTEEGDSYTLLVDQIRKVKVGAKSSASKKQGSPAHAAVGVQPAPRRFVMPLLADLVSVQGDADGHSSSDSDSR